MILDGRAGSEDGKGKKIHIIFSVIFSEDGALLPPLGRWVTWATAIDRG